MNMAVLNIGLKGQLDEKLENIHYYIFQDFVTQDKVN